MLEVLWSAKVDPEFKRKKITFKVIKCEVFGNSTFFRIKYSREKFLNAIKKLIKGPPLEVRGAASLVVPCPGGQTLRPKCSSLGDF